MVGSMWLMGVKISNAALQFLILAVLARLITPTEFGLIGLALLVTSFTDIFNDLGFGPALTQKKEISETDINTSFTASILFGLLLLLILYVASPFLSDFFRNDQLGPILRAVAWILPLRAFTTTPLGLLYRSLEYKKISLIQIISYILGYGVVGIILAFLDYGVWALVWANIIQTVLSTGLYMYYNNHHFKFELNSYSFKHLLSFGGGYSLSKIFTYVGNKGDKVVIGRTLDVYSLGLYERGYQLVRFMAGLVGEVIDKVLFAPFAKKQDQREALGGIYLEITYLICGLLLPASVFLHLNAEAVVYISLGPNWSQTVRIVEVMSLSLFFLVCVRVGSTLAKSLGDVYNRALRNLLYSIIVIVAAYLASDWGVEMVAFVVTIVIGFNYLLAFGQTHKLIKISVWSFISAHFWGIGMSVAYLALSLALRYLHLDMWISFGLNGMALLFVYIGGYYLDQRKVISRYVKLFKKK
jgi:O-antigen/teichoic acid export membrane protein